jgi:hypothetical protein
MNKQDILKINFRNVWLRPLLFFQFYLTAILLLFFLGPWPWPVSNPYALGAYLIAAQFCIAFGYLLAWRRVTAQFSKLALVKAERTNAGLLFLKKSILLTLILALPTSLSRTGQIIPNVLGGLADVGLAYNDYVSFISSGNPYVFVEYVRIFFAPLLIGLLPLTVTYWERLTFRWRCLAGFAFVMHLSIYVASGVNKGIADAIILLPWFWYLARADRVPTSYRRKLLIAAALAVFGFLFLTFFAEGQRLREGNVGEAGVIFDGIEIISAREYGSWEPFQGGAQIAYESLARYLTSGYYGLWLGMQVDSPSTFGFGNSLFLARNADWLSGGDYFTAKSVPGEIERVFGWGQFRMWHSIYAWLASDVGFLGALVVIAAFAYFLGLCWGMSILSLDHRWLCLLSLMLTMFYYISANNQIFQSAETFIGFFVLIIMLWQRKHRKALHPARFRTEKFKY